MLRQGPQQRAGLASLLGRTNPDGVLLRRIHGDVLIENILDGGLLSDGSLIVPAGLEVDALVGGGQVRVTEGDVLHNRGTDGADHQTQTRATHTLDQHIGGAILDSDAVILIPDVAIVNVDIRS